MTESLPGTAPLGEPAAPSVEDPAPGTDEEVVTDSAQASTQMVEAARFNGLMGRFNRTQSELEAARQRIAELEAGPPAKEEPAPVSENADVAGLQAQIAAMQELLIQERIDNARAQAIKDFPGAEAFADLIVADTPEAVRDMAKVLHERVTKSTSTEEPPVEEGQEEQTSTQPAGEQSTEAPEPPAAPQVAGGTTATNTVPAPEERVAAAIKNRSFSDFLKAKFEAQHGSGDLVL